MFAGVIMMLVRKEAMMANEKYQHFDLLLTTALSNLLPLIQTKRY
jgi:hypothetical protein